MEAKNGKRETISWGSQSSRENLRELAWGKGGKVEVTEARQMHWEANRTPTNHTPYHQQKRVSRSGGEVRLGVQERSKSMSRKNVETKFPPDCPSVNLEPQPANFQQRRGNTYM